MSIFDELGGMLQKYAGMSADQAPAHAADDFHNVSQSAPRTSIADGLTEAFRSNQTPPFPSMLSSLFGQSSGQQRAGVLNTLIGTLGPSMVSQLLARSGSANHLGPMMEGQKQVSPELAEQISPQAIQHVAEAAEQKDPDVMQRISEIYSEHPKLIQTLGAGALAVIMGKMANKL
jgi:hypothetical protein